MRKLVACLACRNQSSRLYGKPLQNLSISENISVLDYIITLLKEVEEIDEIVLGISNGIENKVFAEIAKKHSINFIFGDETDVLMRLIKCCEHSKGTDIFRMTTESPFVMYEYIKMLGHNTFILIAI